MSYKHLPAWSGCGLASHPCASMIPYQCWCQCSLVVWTGSTFWKLSHAYCEVQKTVEKLLDYLCHFISSWLVYRNSSLRKPVMWPNGVNIWQWRNRGSVGIVRFLIPLSFPFSPVILSFSPICVFNHDLQSCSFSVSLLVLLLFYAGNRRRHTFVQFFFQGACVVKMIICKLE